MLDILSELTVTRVRAVLNVYTAPGRAMERKNRPAWAILYKYEGETVYKCKGRSLISNAENAVISLKQTFSAAFCRAKTHMTKKRSAEKAACRSHWPLCAAAGFVQAACFKQPLQLSFQRSIVGVARPRAGDDHEVEPAF